MKTSILALLATVGSAIAAPAQLIGRQIINDNGTAATGSSIKDVDILQYALTLEYLEITLYERGVTMFDAAAFQAAGYSADVRERFEEIISQELQHIALLQTSVRMMGSTPTMPCTYMFNFTDVPTFLNTTDAVNGLGPSAYLGAGAFITNKTALTVGASLGNIETRHNSWLNQILGRDAQPTAFLLPLSPNQVYGVASPFIVSCPSTNPHLNAVTAYPPKLTITNPGVPGTPLAAGSTLTLLPGANYTAPAAASAAFLYGFNTTIVAFDASTNSTTIPADTMGQAYVVLTTATQGQVLTDANSLTAPAPFFVDVPASNYANTNITVPTY